MILGFQYLKKRGKINIKDGLTSSSFLLQKCIIQTIRNYCWQNGRKDCLDV